MSECPTELVYAETHEWARLDEDGNVLVGISDFAQEQLGDVVYVELPELDHSLGAAEEAGVVESVKAASDIYAPVTGVVVAVNDALEDAPELVNQDPYGDGWLFSIEPADGDAELEALMDAEDYAGFCDSGDAADPRDDLAEGDDLDGDHLDGDDLDEGYDVQED